MGQELIQGELPANSPRPAETPPEGVIMTDTSRDGYTRRYIYIAMAGSQPEEIVISETFPEKKRVSGAAIAIEESSYQMEGPGIEIPEGVVMPENAVLPENAVFSGLPSEARRAMGGRQGGAPMAVRGAVPMVSMQNAMQQQPLRTNPPVHQNPVSVSTISIQKAAPPPPLMVQPAQSPVPGGQVSVPFIQNPVDKTPEMSGNVRLSNSLDGLKPVAAQSIIDAPRMQAQDRQSRSLPLTTQEAKKTDLYPVSNPLTQNTPMAAGVAQMGGGPSAFIQNQIPLRHLGQAAPPAETQAPPSGGKCPGAVEMPDGRVIEPGDMVSLQDLCELMPFLVETLTSMQAKGLAPGQKVPVVGQQANGQTAVPTSASFGPAGQGAGPYGRAGGAAVGGFGGGGGGPGPAGVQGPIGAPGAPGPGSITEPPVVKVDGDFTAGPGAFVPVPGTAVPFTMATAGVAEVKAIVTLGSGGTQLCENAQIGVRIDGTDYPLTVRLIHTLVGGVGEFHIGQCFTFPITLAPGPHTAELLLRGLLPGEFGGGLGAPASVNANPAIPLIITVSHS